MKIEIEKKVTFDKGDGDEPIVVFNETISASSIDGNSLLGMVDVGNEQQNKASQEKVVLTVSEYIQLLRKG